MPANVHTDTHISRIHMPVHTGTNTQMHARTRGSHGGWCAALCSRIGSSASCELDSPGSVLIPATLFRSPHTHTHALPSQPQPSRGLYQVCFVCLLLSFFTFSLLFLVSTRPPLPQCCEHTYHRPQRKLPRLTSGLAQFMGMHGWKCVCLHTLLYPWLIETCVPTLSFGREEVEPARPKICHELCPHHEIKHPCA